MDKFFHADRIRKPEDVIPHLAKQGEDWKKGYSAYELAHSWVRANGMPAKVVSVLHQAAELRDMELIEAFFEKTTGLRSRGRASQTDLLALIGDDKGFAVLGIEGKVDEPFGPLVSAWLVDASANKRKRLSVLRNTLGLADRDVSDLRYQLLHRTVATIYEAQRYKSREAVMLVHSFSEAHSGFEDFRMFTDMIGTPVWGMNRLSAPVEKENVSLRLAWVADDASP